MAENETPQDAAPQKPAQPPVVTNRIIAQYVRDMSFENILAQKGITGDATPDIQARVDVDARKRGADDQSQRCRARGKHLIAID